MITLHLSSIKTNWTSLDFIFKTMMCVNLLSSTLVIGGQLCNGIISLFSTSLFWKTKSCPISLNLSNLLCFLSSVQLVSVIIINSREMMN